MLFTVPLLNITTRWYKMGCWSNFAIFPYIFHYSGSSIFLVKGKCDIFQAILTNMLLTFWTTCVCFCVLIFCFLETSGNHKPHIQHSVHPQPSTPKWPNRFQLQNRALYCPKHHPKSSIYSRSPFKAQNVSNFQTQEHKMLKNRSFLRQNAEITFENSLQE